MRFLRSQKQSHCKQLSFGLPYVMKSWRFWPRSKMQQRREDNPSALATISSREHSTILSKSSLELLLSRSVDFFPSVSLLFCLLSLLREFPPFSLCLMGLFYERNSSLFFLSSLLLERRRRRRVEHRDGSWHVPWFDRQHRS
jgi:hypothetical protein